MIKKFIKILYNENENFYSLIKFVMNKKIDTYKILNNKNKIDLNRIF